jgi:hypothetical protein
MKGKRNGFSVMAAPLQGKETPMSFSPTTRFTFAMILLAGLPGCATIASDDHQSIVVTSEPPGATCQVREGGDIVTVVNETPGTILVGKSRHDIAIDCQKAGYYPGAAVLQPHFQDWTFGNILYGGTVGVAVDASTGAMNEYPRWVDVLMKRLPSRGESPAVIQRRSELEDMQFRLLVAGRTD